VLYNDYHHHHHHHHHYYYYYYYYYYCRRLRGRRKRSIVWKWPSPIWRPPGSAKTGNGILGG